MEQFQQFLPAPAGALPPQEYGGEREERWKRRALFISLDIGDNLFRRHRYAAAQRHFEFSLILAPGQADLGLRVTRCQPLLPPPPVVPVTASPRPRIAIVDFVVFADPAVVAPGLGAWTPRQLAPYLARDFDVIDSGELYWWMGRLGMSVRDLMEDPYARRWLGRALNARYFVLGNVVPTGSFDVNTYLIDAEYGYLKGRGFVHCWNPFELRCRLGELARMTLTPPAQFQQQRQEYQRYEELIVKARVASGKGDFTLALGFLQDAQKARPGSIEVQVYLNDYDAQTRLRGLEAQRRQDFERQQAEAAKRKQRQDELCHQAEEQRAQAAKLAATLTQEQRLAAENKRKAYQEAAYKRLVLEARGARGAERFGFSIQIYESALNLRQDDAVARRVGHPSPRPNPKDRTNQQRQIEEARLKQTELAKKQADQVAAARVGVGRRAQTARR